MQARAWQRHASVVFRETVSGYSGRAAEIVVRRHRSVIERLYALCSATGQKCYRERIYLLRMVVDVIDIYLTDVTVVLLVRRVDVVIAGVVMRPGMVFDREGIVKLPHHSRVQEGAEQQCYSHDPSYVPYLHCYKSI